MKARVPALLMLVPTLFALSACAATPVPSATNTTPAEIEQVTYLTSFNTFGRDSYAYVALELGYFEEAGFDVTIEPGSGSVDVMKLLASGSADFGAVDFSAAVITVANESIPVTAVGAIHQNTLSAIVTLEGNGIESPADLEGKSFADAPGSTVQVSFPAYAEAADIDPSSVEFVPSTPPALPQLLASNQVDAIGQLVVGEPLIASVAGDREVIMLPYGDLLPDLYGIVLMTSDERAESEPEQVQRFRDALLKGLAYTIEHPEEAAAILVKYQPTQNVAVAQAEVELMAPFVGDSDEIGSIDQDRVANVIKILSGAITGKVKPEDVVSFDLLPAER